MGGGLGVENDGSHRKDKRRNGYIINVFEVLRDDGEVIDDEGTSHHKTTVADSTMYRVSQIYTLRPEKQAAPVRKRSFTSNESKSGIQTQWTLDEDHSYQESNLNHEMGAVG